MIGLSSDSVSNFSCKEGLVRGTLECVVGALAGWVPVASLSIVVVVVGKK